MTKIVLDGKSNRYFDENGYLVIKDNKIAKAGVFEYLGSEISQDLPKNEIYKVYRSFEELKKTAKDFEGMPVKLGHEWASPEKKDLKVGAISGEVKLDEPYLIADIKIYAQKAIEAITTHNITELSPGYTAKYVAETGEYNNEHYEFSQKDIKYNHLAIVEQGRSGQEVRIADEKSIDVKNKYSEVNPMKKLKENAMYALSYSKKVYDESVTKKTDDVDKRELIREIVAISIKPDTDFQGGEEEKFKTILEKVKVLGYTPQEKTEIDDNTKEEKTIDNNEILMKEAFNSFAKLFNEYLEEKEKKETDDNDEIEAKDENEDNKKQVGDSYSIPKKIMDSEINKAIIAERQRTMDAVKAYKDVERYTGKFNADGMNEDEIYQYGYNILTGEKVPTNDAKPSFKAYVKAKVNDNLMTSQNDDDFFDYIK